MKSIFPIFVVAFLLSGCTKPVPGFDLGYRKLVDLRIGLNPFAVHNFEFEEIVVDTNIFKNNNTSLDKITRIEPKQLSLQGLFVAANFGFIEKAEVRIIAPAAGLSEQIIFFNDQVPFNTGERLNLIANNVDLKPYFKAGKFKLRLSLNLRESPPRTIETELPITFYAIY